jgi:glucose/mannose transport system permease protein
MPMRRLTRDRLTSFALIAPSVVVIAVFVYGFIAFNGYSSLAKWNSLLPDFTFVGLRNYQKLFTLARFQIDVRNMLTFIGLFIPVCLAIGFVLAVLLDQRVKGEGLFRSIFLLPMAISAIVTGVAWRWLMSPGTAETGSYGINLLLEQIGLGFLKSGWYTDPQFGIKAVVIAAAWQMSGYTMAMYLAGLRGIPEELREAARIDGASELQIYHHVVLPLLKPITFSAAIILGQIALNIFALVVAMTGPGPGFSTDVPALFMFDTTFRGGNFAVGAAIATIMLLLVMGLVVPYLIHTFRSEVQV